MPTSDELQRALRAAGRAHHEYETTFLEGVRDEQWPGWYCAYVLGRLGDFAAPSGLARCLANASAEGDWYANAAQDVIAEVSIPPQSGDSPESHSG